MDQSASVPNMVELKRPLLPFEKVDAAPRAPVLLTVRAQRDVKALMT